MPTALLLFATAALTALVAGLSLVLLGLRLAGRVPPGAPILAVEPLPARVAVDVGLWVLFALQHSGMARTPFKQWLARRLPAPLERTVYVGAAAMAVLLLVFLWQPLPGVVYDLPRPLDSLADAVGLLGLLVAAVSAALIDGLDLVGLRRPKEILTGRGPAPPRFVTPFLYKVVRHPIQLGVLLLLWGTGTLTVDRAAWALLGTFYILAALPLEEQDLRAVHGAAYRRYQEKVPRLLPRPRRPG